MVAVRLLKAFQIDFSWYRLSSWINLTEQWPLRASMIVLEHDSSGVEVDDNVSLQSLYEKYVKSISMAMIDYFLNSFICIRRVRPKLSCLRDAAPLLELDRDERKLEAFLQLHKHDLLVADLRIFLPFTINLDPYLRKVLKEDQQAMEDEGIVLPMKLADFRTTANDFDNGFQRLRDRPPMSQQRMPIAGQYPMMMHPNALDAFGQQNMMPYQPAAFMPAAANNPSFTMPGFVANNFPAPSAAPSAEPSQRKKSIIENINPFTSDHRNLPPDALSTFPVSERPCPCMVPSTCSLPPLSLLGGPASRSPFEAFGGCSASASQGHRGIGTGLR